MQYSIIVPAYKECGNLEPLIRRVFAAVTEQGFPTQNVEMLIVDDNSRDGSKEVVDRLHEEGFNVHMDVRTTERGLSSAVIHGLRHTSGAYKLVMDADLQHPPECVPALFKALGRDGVEFVCGTRYGVGIEVDKNWPAHRRLISWGARLLARPLTTLSDPMSGFFAIRDGVFKRHAGEVNSIGYKIALELFVKCRVQCFEEVGFNFATRTYGESKLTGKVILHYLEHLYALYLFKLGRLFYVFVVVAVLFAIYLLAFLYHSLF
ncbi:dolicholphosphate-mannose synthase [Leishmania major strain Friedlin]|uniref:Dolichol-phosphate mannosyltransferase subunit 1 n=1 Tax=Leishmania major TaxID=5664 RepID=Q4Q256_LEIMA|nr:dolicholphosphate-mannose synthase [Leishmania major strain Friedlin]CAG9583536.1 dolicholphosphate-mannose_synthase [Leishmania major strain Friedlin]CAJ08973.1 dolicholphosphate-mannose synthase [Leishmania major strain Friedlin]|eukprot:XP_001686592.1 dolicholphosphate-mannose synthase [Leishmania major strain Friedlin]